MLSIIWQGKEIREQQEILEGIIAEYFARSGETKGIRRKLNINGAKKF